jgi:hypothetical protein
LGLSAGQQGHPGFVECDLAVVGGKQFVELCIAKRGGSAIGGQRWWRFREGLHTACRLNWNRWLRPALRKEEDQHQHRSGGKQHE